MRNVSSPLVTGSGARHPGARVLVVDDQEANVRLLERLLSRAGYRHIEGITDSRQVTERVEDFRPDLVLLDLHMPHVDGFAVLRLLRTEVPETARLPVLVLTANATP